MSDSRVHHPNYKMSSHSTRPVRAVCHSPVTSAPEVLLIFHELLKITQKFVWHMVSTLSITSGLYPFLVLLSTFAEFRKANTDFDMSVRPSVWNISAPNGSIFCKIWYFYIFRAPSGSIFVKFDISIFLGLPKEVFL